MEVFKTIDFEKDRSWVDLKGDRESSDTTSHCVWLQKQQKYKLNLKVPVEAGLLTIRKLHCVDA